MNHTSRTNHPASQEGSGSARYIFARHETFHPRFGWIKKGFDAVARDPEIFSKDDAYIQLGVGKNMGRSIRYWCSAFKVIESIEEGKQKPFSAPAEFGQKLLGDDGWDPFLEDPASLWLLHWNLLKSPCQAAAWRFTFDSFRQMDFSAHDLRQELLNYRDGLGLKVSDSSLDKDVSCLLRMYTEQEDRKQLSEESLDCPFVELGLIQRVGGAKDYAFRVGVKSNLPSEIIVAVALEYVAEGDPKQRTVSVASLTYGSGSPGLAFKLTESAIIHAIDEVHSRQRYVSLTDSAGLVQMSFQEDPKKLSLQILNRYYAR
jgi:hypothetical protein